MVSPQRQILFVYASGFIEQRIDLINPSPKQVFYYQVEERSGQNETSVIFLVEPKDAKLYVDNILMDINQTVNVPLGMVNVRLEREGYRPVEEPLMISPNRVNYTFAMREVTLEPVRIRTNVDDARVEINDTDKGITDVIGGFDLFLFPGVYTIRLSKRNFIPEFQTVSVEEDGENQFVFNLEKNVGYLDFNIEPSDAELYINKVKYSTKSTVEKPPGMYQIDVERYGFAPYTKTLELGRNQQEIIDVKLDPTYGAMLFSCSPTDAAVVMRNSQGDVFMRWRGIKSLRNVPVGRYTIEVRSSGFRTTTEHVRIKENEEVDVNISLKENLYQSRRRMRKQKWNREDPQNNIMLTLLPRLEQTRLSLENANLGLYFSHVKNKWGFYTELGGALNATTSDFVYENGVVVTSEYNQFYSNGYFLPEVSIRSLEIGGGVVYRVNYLSVTAGLSYYTYQYFQRMEITLFDSPWVLVPDRGFRGVIPKLGIVVDIKGLTLGYSIATYHSRTVGSMLLIGFSF